MVGAFTFFFLRCCSVEEAFSFLVVGGWFIGEFSFF